MADPWVAPDTQASPAHAPVVAPPAPPTPTATRGAAELAVPVPLRPLTAADMLDGGLRAWKLAPGTMVALAALFVVPAQVALGVLTRDAVDDTSIRTSFADAFAATGPDDVETGFAGGAFVVGMVLNGLALALVTAGVARLITGWYVGHRHRFGTLATGALRRSWALIVAWGLVHVVEAVFAVGLLVPAVVAMTWYAVVSPVIACEGAGPLRAMRRSYGLCKRRFGVVLGLCLLTALVDAVLSFALGALGALYLELGWPAGWAVNTAVASASLLVTTPFVAGVATLLYLDLRVRTEGLDIELAVAQRFTS